MKGKHRVEYLFASELFGRLVWFVRLRWLAVAGLGLASLLGPSLGVHGASPALLIVALFVGAANVFFTMALRRRKRRELPYDHLLACALRQIMLDLTALIVTAHFTGGLQSPALLFFAFHMAIGTIILPAKMMYPLAACTSVAMFLVYFAETRGFLSFHPLDPSRGMCGAACHFNIAALIFALFGVVALTDSVTSRFKKRNVKLWDTTEELKKRTKDLQRSLEQVETVEERKSHYMRISAHQLRSPLATIKTSLQVLTEGYVDPVSDRGRKLLQGAAERVDELLATVNDLLELAKIREGLKCAPWAESVNLNQLLADLFDALQPLAEVRSIRLVPSFRGVCILDRGIPPDLVYAFENLMENAIKYSKEGGEVEVRLSREHDRAVIEIEDHGIGIPPGFDEEVLNEFVRAPNAKHHAQGTGLGLAIARETMEAHGGSLRLESREGEGTIARAVIPLHGGTPESPPQSED